MKTVIPIYGVQPVLEALRSKRKVSRVLLARAEGGMTQKLRDEAASHRVPVADATKEELTRLVGHPGHQGVFAELAANVEAPGARGDEGEDRSAGSKLRAQERPKEVRVGGRRSPKQEPEPIGEIADLGEAEVDQMLAAAGEKGEPPLILLLDHIQDPHNLGALIRSAHALGAHGVVIPKDRAAPITAAVVRASAGAALHVPISRVTNLKRALDELRDAGVWSAAAVLKGEPSWSARLDGPLALVVGSEGKGVSPTLAEYCDLKVTIPLPGGFDSLNASVAGGVLLYEVLRQRRKRDRTA